MSHPSVGTPATTALLRAGVPFTLRPYEHDPRAEHFGPEVAQVLGIEPGRTFKTLIVELDGDHHRLVTALVPSDRQLDLKAIASAAGAKRAALAEPGLAQRATGFVVGGISPFGQRRRTRVFIDASAMDHPSVLVSGGRRGLSVEMDPHDIVAVTRGVPVRLARS